MIVLRGANIRIVPVYFALVFVISSIFLQLISSKKKKEEDDLAAKYELLGKLPWPRFS